jgi:hypothetical protein
VALSLFFVLKCGNFFLGFLNTEEKKVVLGSPHEKHMNNKKASLSFEFSKGKEKG